MNALSTLIEGVLDILFPRRGLEQEILALSEEKLSEKLHLRERDGAVSLFPYRNPLIRHMVWMLKYKGNRHVAELFAGALSDYLLEELSDIETFDKGARCALVPLPLSGKRERERGFNQMRLITDALKARGDFTIAPDLLKRVKHTDSQTSLKDKSSRRENVRGVFRADEKLSRKYDRIIVIDDVLTTGSTLREARSALRETGVQEVYCIALAH